MRLKYNIIGTKRKLAEKNKKSGNMGGAGVLRIIPLKTYTQTTFDKSLITADINMG